MKMKMKNLDAMLSVATAESAPMPEGLAERVSAAGTEGFASWSGRRQRSGQWRNCAIAAVVSVLLCGCVHNTEPEAVKTHMIVNDGSDRAHILAEAHQMLEYAV